jgi:hypothetical protein
MPENRPVARPSSSEGGPDLISGDVERPSQGSAATQKAWKLGRGQMQNAWRFPILGRRIGREWRRYGGGRIVAAARDDVEREGKRSLANNSKSCLGVSCGHRWHRLISLRGRIPTRVGRGRRTAGTYAVSVLRRSESAGVLQSHDASHSAFPAPRCAAVRAIHSFIRVSSTSIGNAPAPITSS